MKPPPRRPPAQPRPGRCRLAIWIPVRMREDLTAAAAAEGCSQREIVEAAVRAYCKRLRAEPAPT